MSAAHALLSPSAAHRWMACPGSVKLTEGRDDGGSVYSREGTAAHDLARHCLETGTDAAEHLGRVIDHGGCFANSLADGDAAFEVTAEMVAAVQTYIDTARPYLHLNPLIEARVATPIADCWGTLDFGAHDPQAGRLTVLDFKYGKGVIVEAKGNAQLLTYASGLLAKIGEDEVDEIELVIVQPRRLHAEGPVRQMLYTKQELRQHVADARHAASLVECDPPVLHSGAHCKFCRASSFCPAFLKIRPNDRAPERSEFRNHRETEMEMTTSDYEKGAD
jgi:hypothetical protein